MEAKPPGLCSSTSAWLGLAPGKLRVLCNLGQKAGMGGHEVCNHLQVCRECTGSAQIHFLFDDVGRTINNPCALRQAQAPNEDLRNILRKSQNVRDQKGP